MVQKVMRQIITNVAKNTTAVACQCCIPIVGKYHVSDGPERYGKNGEQGWRHDETISVHWEIVMDTMEKEMEGEEDAIIG